MWRELVAWFRWCFGQARRCEHVRVLANGRLVNGGVGKAWYCARCGKCLEVV